MSTEPLAHQGRHTCGRLVVNQTCDYGQSLAAKQRKAVRTAPVRRQKPPLGDGWYLIRVGYLAGLFGYGWILPDSVFLYAFALAMWTVAGAYALLGQWYSGVSTEVMINAGGGLLGFSAYSAWLVTKSVWWALLWLMPIPTLLFALTMFVALAVQKHRARPRPAG
ncbi:hypothetical protein [Streptomyces sp. A5-4]|uniref:hypothetical protein n=1 Tax=Streptomyces sp. A5-4 TaxID=3384771 RepID=UPI003DAA4312